MFLILLMVTTVGLLLFFLIEKYYRGLKIESCQHRYVLITGCDTGFGNKAARRLDGLGLHVFATCLTKNKMEELSSQCSERLVPIHLDVTDETSVKTAFEIIKDTLPPDTGLWAILNNAGIVGPVGLCEWLGKEHFQKTIRVNVLGTVTVTNTFLPLVRKSKGRIINTSSVVGRLAFSSAPYSVSKFCLEGYTDTLRRQLAILGVSVHAIEPGGYATNITDANLINSSMEENFDALDEEVRDFYGEDMKYKLSQMTRLTCYLVGSRNLDQVVDAYVHAVTARYPKTRYLVGFSAHLVFRPLWSIPTFLTDFLMGMCYPLPKGCS